MCAIASTEVFVNDIDGSKIKCENENIYKF